MKRFLLQKIGLISLFICLQRKIIYLFLNRVVFEQRNRYLTNMIVVNFVNNRAVCKPGNKHFPVIRCKKDIQIAGDILTSRKDTDDMLICCSILPVLTDESNLTNGAGASNERHVLMQFKLP